MNKSFIICSVFLLLAGCQQNGQKEREEIKKSTATGGKAVINDQFIDGHPVDNYLNSSDIDDIVLNYYYGKILVEEDEQTGDLLNTLIEKKGDLVPLYFRCFMNICRENGQELENYLGKYCIRLLKEQTYYCVKKLRQGSPDYFTGLVANEIYQNPDWEQEINNLSVELHTNLENEAPEFRKELDLFIVGLKNDIEHLSSL